MPQDLTVASGETRTISTGDTEVYEVADVDGTLSVNGTLTLTGSWAIDGRAITPAAIKASARDVILEFTVLATDVSHWRQYDSAGDVIRIPQNGGGFRLVDNSGRSPVTVSVPAPDRPPFNRTIDGYVDDYNEEQLSPDRYQISLTILRTEPRPAVTSQATDTATYEFDTSRGVVGLDADDVGQLETEASGAGRIHELQLRVDDETAARLLDAWSTPTAIVERAVPDGEDVFVDTADGGQTVSISTPTRASLAAGDYGITDWTLTQSGFGTHRWTLAVSLAGLD